MATPITWQNVQGRSLAEAATPLQYAAQNIGSAFDKLGGVYKDYQTQQQKQIDDVDALRVQNFLDRVQGAASPEAVAQLKASGELDAMRAGIVNPKNMALVRGADEARLTAVRSLTEQGQRFVVGQEAVAAQPLIDQANLFVQNNDQLGLKNFLAENQGKIPDPARFLSSLRGVANTVATQNMAVDKNKREETKLTQDNLESNARIAEAKRTADAAILTGQQTAVGRSITAATDAIKLLEGEGGGSGNGQGGTGGRAGSVSALLKDLVPDEDTRTKMAGKIAPLLSNPLYRGLTDRELVGIAMQTKDTRGWFDSTFGIGDGPKSAPEMADAITGSADYGKRTAQVDAVDGMRRNLAQSLYAGLNRGAAQPGATTTENPPVLPTIPTPTEPAAKPTISSASAAIRGTNTTLIDSKPVSNKQSSRDALPDYKGRAVNNETGFDSIARSTSAFFDKVNERSQRNNAQSTAIEIKSLLDEGSYINPLTLKRAQEAAKKYPDQFEPSVLDWVAQTQASSKKAK